MQILAFSEEKKKKKKHEHCFQIGNGNFKVLLMVFCI